MRGNKASYVIEAGWAEVRHDVYSEEITRKKILLIIISTDPNVYKLLILVSKYSGSVGLIMLTF